MEITRTQIIEATLIFLLEGNTIKIIKPVDECIGFDNDVDFFLMYGEEKNEAAQVYSR